ncbi:CocE/NonD family hydrolase [Steroidobacter sp.]|uniref:CocE/NonD family hydrolase n=1 Tax=Steroidobacter sp. TaxID=1978227 RepID=UPI0025F777EF|nr:CocE/NonD family hydrolase [Steroidobacter sp.]
MSTVALLSHFLIAASVAAATPEAEVDRNVFVPMRDGVRLATDVYLPANRGNARVPVVLIRTPYRKDRAYKYYDTPSTIVKFLNHHGYAVAVQDKRGRFHSEGVYVVSGGDANDGYDTVDWLSKQPWSSGKVGAFGCSYEGDVQIFMAQTRHPALKAIIPQAAGSSVGSLGGHYRYFGGRVGGVNELVSNLGWFAQYGEKVFARLPADLPRDQYNALAALWEGKRANELIDLQKAWTHLPMKDALAAQGMAATDFEDNVTKAADDPYWSALPYMTEGYVSDVPALHINSWYDFGADMTLLEFNHMRSNSASATARDNQFVIMSPHTHCAFESQMAERTLVGEYDVGDTRFDYREAYLTWFDAWLKDDAQAHRRIKQWPRIRYYAMGRNRWQSASEWPVSTTRDRELFLASTAGANSVQGDGRLLDAPAIRGRGADSFIYDPANPVPSRGGQLCCTGTPDAEPGALDQRPVEARHDVLVYSTDPLRDEVEMTGEPRVVLFVSSDAIDTDFTVKLVDVHPDGRALNLLDSVLRARYREGQQREVWMRPGEAYELTIPLGATSNVFKAGHRIRLEISSSNFPRFERNLNVGGINAAQANWVVARNTVHHTQLRPSRLILPVSN